MTIYIRGMRFRIRIFLFLVAVTFIGFAQDDSAAAYNAGFLTIRTVDNTRIFKPDAINSDRLHYRTLDLDIWYPTT